MSTPRTTAVHRLNKGDYEEMRMHAEIIETELIAAQAELATLRECKAKDDAVMAMAAKEFREMREMLK